MQQQANYLQQLLVSLRTRLLVMCASVGIALEDAGKAMAAGDPGRAASVIENDAAIDALEMTTTPPEPGSMSRIRDTIKRAACMSRRISSSRLWRAVFSTIAK